MTPERPSITNTAFQALALFTVAARFAPLHRLVSLVVPKSVTEKRHQFHASTNAKLARRLGDENAPPDL